MQWGVFVQAFDVRWHTGQELKSLRYLLPYFQASRWACHSVVEAGRAHRMPRSEAEIFPPYWAASGVSLMLALVWPGRCCTLFGLVSQLRVSKFKSPKSFIMGVRPCLTIALEGDLFFIILDISQTCHLLQREVLSVSSSCSLFPPSWKDVPT